MYDYSNDNLFTTTSFTNANYFDNFNEETGPPSQLPPSTLLSPPPPLLPNYTQINYEVTAREVDDSIFNETLFTLKSEVDDDDEDDYNTVNNNNNNNTNVNLSSPICNFVQKRPSLIQRSMSISHPQCGFFHPNFSWYGDEFDREFLNPNTDPIRKVFSTGDLQINTKDNNLKSINQPLHENSTSEGIKKVGRYTAEERKERIERYRSKRNQRNFTKKIKYACRKTLADSRPRVRGRFMRNDDSGESSHPTHSNHVDVYEDDEVWINLLDSFSMNLIP